MLHVRLTNESELSKVDLISEVQIKLSRIVGEHFTSDIVTNTSTVAGLLVVWSVWSAVSDWHSQEPATVRQTENKYYSRLDPSPLWATPSRIRALHKEKYSV